MATIAAKRGMTSAQLLVLMLGAAVFINYVDRGAIAVAAPLMQSELSLTATQFGLAVSAFFWVYAPVQLLVGWLCDRFSVYRLLSAGILLWAGSTLLMGFAGGLLSLLVLRIMLGVGESIAFPGTSKIIARHIPDERRGIANAAVSTGLALGPAVGTLAGGSIVATLGWRPMFVIFGIATLLWLAPWKHVVKSLGPVAAEEPASARVPVKAVIGKGSLWAMGIGHCLGNYSFYVLLAWLPLFLVRVRGYSIEQMTLLATLGYAVQAAAALLLGTVSDKWTRAGRSEAAMRRWMLVAGQVIAAVAVLGIAFSGSTVMLAFWLCIGGVTTAALSLNIYAVAQMFAGPRASGTWVGVQNAIGNLSGIVGPVISGMIIDRAGYDGVFIVAAAVAAAGALWWAFAVPAIKAADFR